MIITPTSLTISQLFGSTNEQYIIPTYQRRYSWHERQVWELIDDIRLIEEKDTHLLGSIVCLVGYFQAGLNTLEIVDGQQRLTTISILLECMRQRLVQAGETEEAADLGRLLSARALGGKSMPKVLLDSIDSAEFERLLQESLQDGGKNQNLVEAFRIIREWIQQQKLEDISRFLYRLKNQAIVIRLDVGDAKDAFKLFETINNRGLRLSPTDIIKNFLLGNAARFGEQPLKLARESWAALLQHLDGTSPDAFFRYYLMTLVRSRLTAAKVVPEFKKLFMTQVSEAAGLPERHLYADADEVEDDEDAADVSDPDDIDLGPVEDDGGKVDFREFVQRLVQCAKVYGELVLVKTPDSVANRHLRNLKMIKAVQTYGFLMHLRVGGCSEKTFREVLKLTESFVLRRHVCRERSNETEALFARLCGVDPATPIEATRLAYRELCPTDDKFREEFAAANFPANRIDRARYVLEQIELSKHGTHEELQVLGAEDVHVEHIIPQKVKTKKSVEDFGDWLSYLGDKAETLHAKYVSRIGNLTIFAGALNIGASNNPFIKKKQAYRDSSIKITRELLNLNRFNFKSVEKRSKDLAAAAVGLWPAP